MPDGRRSRAAWVMRICRAEDLHWQQARNLEGDFLTFVVPLASGVTVIVPLVLPGTSSTGTGTCKCY